MPRAPRILVDNGYYHVVTRGIDRRKLFRYNCDYDYFLKVTTKYLSKFQIYILHYCLMPNHLHLLVKAGKAEDLPKFMQAVLQVYAAYFRKKYDCVGFVFQNRYKSCLIDSESYLLECARYIERNPLRAKLIDNLLQYPWSSFLMYAKGVQNDIINLINPLYPGLSITGQECRKKYFGYVTQNRPYDHIVDKEFRIK
ncbi:MAG: transposase [Candidatus Omnitrophica bacterium]|nr:transposase [Candidatus Omnitrophota bacterium]